jgi:diguanylate cyclase (GGDEF)-like protein/PAS domain S-box-containing protein
VLPAQAGEFFKSTLIQCSRFGGIFFDDLHCFMSEFQASYCTGRGNEVGGRCADKWGSVDCGCPGLIGLCGRAGAGACKTKKRLREHAMDRTELLESALDALPDGIALFGMEGEVVFWNHAAEAITGYTGADVLGQAIPEGLGPRAPERLLLGELQASTSSEPGRGALVKTRHKLGHQMQTIARVVALRDGLGEQIGTAAVFHPAESLDALPHGATGEDKTVEASQANLEERLQIEFEDFVRGAVPFGVLWIGVDQAHDLRKTHGLSACEAMLEKVQRALAQGLRPGEELGRWGEDEFLIISYERTPEMLAAHAQALAGMARTADFRWWGDRISVTVSIGAAQAVRDQDEGLTHLMERAQKAMENSIRGGGNRVTVAPRRQECLPS